MIDLNDFDEAHPGGWEWDLRRLVASIWVAGRTTARPKTTAAPRCARASRPTGRRSAAGRRAAVLALVHPAGRRPAGTRAADGPWPTRSTGRPNGRATAPATGRCPGSPKRSTAPSDRRRAAADHPAPRTEAERWPRRSMTTCRRCPPLAPGARRLHPARRRAQGGRRRAASGCARTWRCWRDRAPEDVIFLQLKQARRSVLARYVHGERRGTRHQGQRVVEYQQALQTVSDPLLGLDDGRTACSTTCGSSAT